MRVGADAGSHSEISASGIALKILELHLAHRDAPRLRAQQRPRGFDRRHGQTKIMR